MTQKKLQSRHHAREIALQILYQYDLQSGKTDLASPSLGINEELQQYFQHFQIEESLRPFIESLVRITLQHLPELDQLLGQHTAHWRISRMSLVDRSLLRMATCELTHFKETPPSVVINEAIELAKHFGGEETPAFVNGILDSILHRSE